MLALVSFFVAFFKKLSDYRSVANVPTSRIATAAQGFVELNCRVCADNQLFLSPRFKQVCVWFHLVELELQGTSHEAQWVVINEEFSGSPIWLEDDSGARLLVHPDFLIQNKLPSLSETEPNSVSGNVREYALYYLKASDMVMVNGQFATFGQPERSLVRHLLGPNAKQEEHAPMLSVVRELVELASRVAPLDAVGSRLHVVSFSDHHNMGMIHYGCEKTYLYGKKLGLGFTGLGLLVSVALTSFSAYEWLTLYNFMGNSFP